MTHDPMCYMAEGKWDGGCQCGLIARVRADERNKIFTHLDELSSNNHVDYCRDLYCGGCYEIGDNE